MKKLVSVILMLSLLVTVTPLAYALSYNKFTYIENDDGTVTITAYTDFFTEALQIPAEIDGKAVTAIGASAFRNKSSIISAVIPDSVVTVDGLAFYGCSNLKTVTIGASVKSLGENCFNLCTSLSSINLGAVEKIGEFAFYGCKALTSVNTGSALSVIPKRAFSGCKALASITFSNALTVIDDYAFANCPALVTLQFPNSLSRIGNSAFVNAAALSSVTFGTGELTIDGYAFENCPALTKITIPKNVVSIGRNAFAIRDQITFSHANIEITCNAHSAAVGYCFRADVSPYIIELKKAVMLGNIVGIKKELKTDDALLALKVAAGIDDSLSDKEKMLADVDGDGYHTTRDARAILQKALGIYDGMNTL